MRWSWQSSRRKPRTEKRISTSAICYVRIGGRGRRSPLIIANVAWAAPVSAWLMKSTFQGVPADLENAALVDGCSRIGAFFRIAVPLALPGIAATTVFAFISAWDEYLFARTFVSNSIYWVVSVGLGSFTGDYSTSWQQIMAVATLSTLPPAILFLFVQRAFVDGIASGGLKG